VPEDKMTPRERWEAVLNHELPDRLPTDYWATDEADKKLRDYLGCETKEQMLERLHVDQVVVAAGRYVGPELAADEDVFGSRFRMVSYGPGVYKECVYRPLADYDPVEEIEANYTWPSPDWWDYTHVPTEVAGKEHLPIRVGGAESLLTYKRLRGMEQAYMDLALHPEMVHYCLGKIFDLTYEELRRTLEKIPGEALFARVGEDLGSQEGLLISRRHIHEFLLPQMKRMMDLVHEAGACVFHHSDGAVRDIVPDMIEAGIDLLNPIQWRCKGMDREGLKRDFGHRIALHGAMDNQYTLAFGTVDEVRREVLDNIAILGRGGGYILAPCHNIQAVSPPENIVAMYDTAYENGWY